MKPLFQFLASYFPISEEIKNILTDVLTPRPVSKKEILLKEGQVCRHIYFIESGLIRIFYMLNGKEVTSWLLKENNIFIGVESFFGQTPSRETIVALEDGLIWGITYQQLEMICKLHPSFCWNRIYITEAYYRLSMRMHADIFMKTGMEKYRTLMETAPDLLHRVPLKYIYSYLGVGKSTFERIRDEYAASRKIAVH